MRVSCKVRSTFLCVCFCIFHWKGENLTNLKWVFIQDQFVFRILNASLPEWPLLLGSLFDTSFSLLSVLRVFFLITRQALCRLLPSYLPCELLSYLQFYSVAKGNLRIHNCWMHVIHLFSKIANTVLEATVITLGCTRRTLGILSLINWLTILPLPSFLTHLLNYIEFVMTVSLIFPNCIINPESIHFLELASPSYNLIWPEAWL